MTDSLVVVSLSSSENDQLQRHLVDVVSLIGLSDKISLVALLIAIVRSTVSCSKPK